MTNEIVTVKRIIPSAGSFEIRRGDVVYRIMDRLADPMTQDRLADFYEQEKQKGNPLPTNSRQVFGVMQDAFNSGNNELKNFLYNSVRNKFLLTLSRPVYNPAGQDDEIIHNYRTSDAYSISGNFVGPDCLIKNISDKRVLEASLGTSDTGKIDETANYINKTPMHLWRVDAKPERRIERVARFNAVSYWLGLGLYVGPSYVYPSLRVEQIQGKL